MSAQDELAILAAGGLLPIGAATPKGEPIDAVGARAYSHPALPGRVVVRLSPDNLAAADDLEMEVLGFSAPEVRGTVGQQRRRALGFPGSALVHDPKNARYALDVVKDLRKAARKAKSKPGHAKEMIDPLGEALARSVPHFLPSFYEEVGRAFIEVDAHKYAAQYFEKAREAERVHALAIDEDVRRDAFLEFALAGAVSIKSLSAYAKDLEKTASPAEAYRQFRQLCVKRTLGGLPPWGSMSKELARLAKGAGLDLAAEQRSFLEEILESPSLSTSAAEFWKSYKKPLVELARGSAKIRALLLNLMPDPSPSSAGFFDAWLELLDEAGALEGVWDASAEAQPASGAAAWLSAFYALSQRGWREKPIPARLFAILERAAPRLIAEGTPVAFVSHSVQLDLTDRALELGVAVKDPVYVDLARWARQAGEPGCGRDFVHLGADPRFAPWLDAALDQAIGSEPFETVARGKRALAAARRGWLERAIERASSGGLPDLSAELTRLGNQTSAKTFAEIPEPYAKLAAIDPAPALARTLRAGIFDELGWPAYDEAVAGLCAGRKDLTPRLCGAFPYVCVTDDVRVIVVGPKGRALEHDLRVPKGSQLQTLRYAQGQLLVVLRDASWKWTGYWSGAPDEVFPLDASWSVQELGGYGVELADGSFTEGGRALSAGDRKVPEVAQLLHDGVTFWRREWAGTAWKLREFDPRTGEKGRFSLPAFFEGWAREGMTLDVQRSWIGVLPEGVEGSPFGAEGRLVGWRVRVRDHSSPHGSSAPAWEMESLGGARMSGDPNAHGVAPLALPGGDPLLLGQRYYRHQAGWALIDPESGAVRSDVESTRGGGSAARLTPAFWHLFGARDAEGSRALRALSDASARALLDAHGTVEDDAAKARVREKIGELLPGMTDGALKEGVAKACAATAELSVKLAGMKAALDPAGAPSDGAACPSVSVDDARAALAGILEGYGHGESFSEPIAVLSRFFARGSRSPGESAKVEKCSFDWTPLIGRIGAVAFRSIHPAFPAHERETLLAILEVWAGTIFAEHPARFRALKGRVEKALPAFVFERGGNDYWARASYGYGGQIPHDVLEHAPSGAFAPLEGLMIDSEVRCPSGWGGEERIRALVAAARERGTWTWDAAAVELLVERTGLTRPEAALLLGGMPNVDAYQSTFLSKEARATMGLKTTEASAARDSLKSLTLLERAELYAAAMPEDVGDALDPLKLAARLADAWVQKRGKRVAVPEELVLRADAELALNAKPAEMLAALAEPEARGWLTTDAEWSIDENGSVKASVEGAFNAELAAALVRYVPWLHLGQPVGDPFLASVPRVLALLRERASNDSLLVHLTQRYFWEADGTGEAKRAAMLEAIGGVALAGQAHRRDEGRVVALASPKTPYLSIYFRPARLRTEADWAWVATLAETGSRSEALEPLRALGLGALEPFAERVRTTPVPVGQYEANPLASVPALVEKVRAKHDLGEDAAALYLQTLALIAPTAKLVQAWNGWTKARYTKAQQELVARELLLEAKRARAQRTAFLPGAWEALGAPHMPFESWKMPLYDVTRDEHGRLTSPLERFLPPRPLHTIFEAAWARIEAGDVPRYEEVKR